MHRTVGLQFQCIGLQGLPVQAQLNVDLEVTGIHCQVDIRVGGSQINFFFEDM